MIAKDTPQEIAERYIEYRRKVMSPSVSNTAGK
jgi:hypothetical protein